MKPRKGSTVSLWQQNMERFANLRWRLTALFAMMLLCTLVVIGIGIATFVRRAEVAAWRGRQTEATRNTVNAVTNLLENTRRSLNLINLVGLDELESNGQLLDKIRRQYPLFQEIVYLNSQGEAVTATTAATLLRQKRREIVEAPWFVAIQSGKNYYYDDVTVVEAQRPDLVLSIAAPNASVIVARVDLFVLWELVANSGFGDSGIAYIVDRSGRIVAHTNRTLAVNQQGVPQRPEWMTAPTSRDIWYGEYRNLQEERVVGAVAPVPSTDWLVITELAASEAFAASRWAYLILGGGMLAFTILMMWVSAEWLEGLILLPIERLRDGAAHIGQGDLAYRIELMRSDEIGQVAAAFNQMAAELEGVYASLEQKIAERTAQLQEQSAELARSNAELAQFAYVVSHDLQEPLRMITGYLQLLERRYKGQLGKDGDEFITFALDGATRMRQLIRDLLAYSRVGVRHTVLQAVDCQEILNGVLDNLQVAIHESGAIITCDPLPTLYADPTHLGQLFQNLVANAIKFRGAQAPQIQIGVRRTAQSRAWLFSVRDNGIGIAPEYFERIFAIFQRLHTRSEYLGTGIGLAICKKIVDRHGGHIWVESVVGKGTTFYFTIPDKG
ncbi:MAG: ATP-binding protein [Caldilineaceae bacterium]